MITLTHTRIVGFYERNPQLDPEALNLWLVQVLESLGENLTQTLQTTALGELSRDVRALGAHIQTANAAFLADVRTAFSAQEIERARLVQTSTTTLISRLLADLPADLVRRMQDPLATLERCLRADLQNLRSDANLAVFLATLDAKLAALQQPLFALVQANQDTVARSLTSVRDDLGATKTTQDRVFTQLTEFLSTVRGSAQAKGVFSENVLEALLPDAFPTAHIETTTGQTAKGDFYLTRPDLPDLLIETKNYGRNVDLAESRKFLRDVLANKCNGLMLSQRTGIVGKENFGIDIHGACVLVYLHNVQFDAARIRVAADVADRLSARLSAIAADGFAIPKDALDTINTQFASFMQKRLALASAIRDSAKPLLAQLDALELPALAAFLNASCTSVATKPLECPHCQKSCKNAQGLASHISKLHPR